MGVHVYTRDRRAPPREFERVKARVAADVERRPAAQILGQMSMERAPLERGKVAQKVLGRGLGTVGQVQVVKPGRKPRDRLLHL